MDHRVEATNLTGSRSGSRTYEPPQLTDHGSLVDLTLKATGAADGSTFLGTPIGPPTS